MDPDAYKKYHRVQVSTLGGADPVVLCRTFSVLLCVLEQPRVDNYNAGPNWEQLVQLV